MVANTWDNLNTHFFFTVTMQNGFTHYLAMMIEYDDILLLYIDAWVNKNYGFSADWCGATPREREKNNFELLLGSEVAPERY